MYDNDELLNQALLDLMIAVKKNNELQQENLELRQKMEGIKYEKRKN